MVELTNEIVADLTRLEVDHEGHAQSCLILYPDLFKHTTTHGWLKYNGRFWDGEGAEQAVERAITNTLMKRRELFAAREDWQKAKSCAARRNNVTGTKSQLAKASSIYKPIAHFDSSKDLLNAGNGVVNLKTGELSPHAPDQYFTYCLPVSYDPMLARTPDLWLEFLFTCGLVPDIIEYLRLALGYSLTGYTSEEVMFYLCGKSRSGKGTTMETVNAIIGKLSTGVDMQTFTGKRYGDTSNFDLAPLKNKRFITASESQRHGMLNPAFIKKITGGDEIYCSFKRKDHFSYRPQFKIWLTSNFEANTDVDDDAAWGRLRVISYPLSFLGNEDKTLKGRLLAQSSLDAIFAWMVSGAIDWYAIKGTGLPMPDEIKKATDEHRAALDSITQFTDEMCVMGDDLFVVGSRLYMAYKAWCEDEGYMPLGRKRFTQSMANKGVLSKSKRTHLGVKRGYVGIDFVTLDEGVTDIPVEL